MFYFPGISSGYEIRECESKVHKKLEDLYKDLEILVQWENTYNMEMHDFDEVAKHQYLKNVIDGLLGKESNRGMSFREALDEAIKNQGK